MMTLLEFWHQLDEQNQMPRSRDIYKCPKAGNQTVFWKDQRNWIDDSDMIEVLHQSPDAILSDGTVELICRYEPVQAHFPHAMQTIYKCWSWWYFRSQDLARQNTTIQWKVSTDVPCLLNGHRNYSSCPTPSPFKEGIWTMLHDHLNVAFVDTNYTQEKLGAESNAGGPYLEEVSVSTKARLSKHEKWFMEGETAEKIKPKEGPVRTKAPGALRQATLEHLFPTKTLEQPTIERVRVGILNRKETRVLLLDEPALRAIFQALEERITLKNTNENRTVLPNILFEYVPGFENWSFEDQVSFFARTDILVSVHGAQLTGLPFQVPCGGLLEIFPKSYWLPGFFGSLALDSGLDYAYLYQSQGDPETETQAILQGSFNNRMRQRRKAVCVDHQLLMEAILELVDRRSMRVADCLRNS